MDLTSPWFGESGGTLAQVTSQWSRRSSLPDSHSVTGGVMNQYRPASVLSYASVSLARPEASAAAINFGQIVTGRIVSSAQDDSYIAADAADRVVTSAHAGFGTPRADAKSRHFPALNHLILFVFERVGPNTTYFRGMGVLNLGSPSIMAPHVDCCRSAPFRIRCSCPRQRCPRNYGSSYKYLQSQPRPGPEWWAPWRPACDPAAGCEVEHRDPTRSVRS